MSCKTELISAVYFERDEFGLWYWFAQTNHGTITSRESFSSLEFCRAESHRWSRCVASNKDGSYLVAGLQACHCRAAANSNCMWIARMVTPSLNDVVVGQ